MNKNVNLWTRQLPAGKGAQAQHPRDAKDRGPCRPRWTITSLQKVSRPVHRPLIVPRGGSRSSPSQTFRHPPSPLRLYRVTPILPRDFWNNDGENDFLWVFQQSLSTAPCPISRKVQPAIPADLATCVYVYVRVGGSGHPPISLYKGLFLVLHYKATFRLQREPGLASSFLRLLALVSVTLPPRSVSTYCPTNFQ